MKRCIDEEEIPSLTVALTDYMNAGELKKLAALTGLRAPTRKAELVDFLVRHLEGDGLRAVWQGLDELQQAAVAEVVHSSGSRFLPGRFQAKYGRQPSWGSVSEYQHDKRATALRFFFYGSEGGGGVMPADLKERLKAFVPSPPPVTVTALSELPDVFDRPYTRWNDKTRKSEEGTEPVPIAAWESERPAQRELLAVLRLVDAGKVAVSEKTHRPSATTIATVTGVLESGDFYAWEPPKSKWHDENAGPIRAFAWPLLVQAGGLARTAGPRLQLTALGRKALAAPAADTLRWLWQRWIASTILDELTRIDCVKGQSGKGGHSLTAVAGRRKSIADTLAECPAGGWISTEEFLRFLQASGRDFAVLRHGWGLYIGDAHYGSLGYEGGDGFLMERYSFCLLLEYAATLGLLDVAFVPPAEARRDYFSLWGTDELPYLSRYDGLLFLRINSLGAWVLGLNDKYSPAPLAVKPVLRVLPNLEIAAIDEGLEPGDRLALDAYAVPASERVWQLQPGKLLLAVEEGRTIEEIRGFLAARSSSPLPDTVLRLLQDVAERCGKLQDRGPARLIECAEPALAALIANDTRTRKHCLRAGERHLAVPASSETAFRRALRDLGYLLAAGEAGLKKVRRERTHRAQDSPPAEA